MKQAWWAAGVTLAIGIAAAAQAQWPTGWGVGYGGGGELGRTEGPLTLDVTPINGGVSVSVTVSGCGGVRDFRSFGTDISDGDGQTADAAAGLTRLLGEARRACGFEPRLATRVAQGFEPAFSEWAENYRANMAAMTMDMNAATADMNAADMDGTYTDMNSMECAADGNGNCM